MTMPDIILENEAKNAHHITYVAGLDEAGRGAIAGPVFAAAVILPLDRPEILARLLSVNDSKLLTPEIREELYDLIIECALAYGIGSSSAREVDEMGIIPANQQAMIRALQQLNPAPECLLLDGRMRLPTIPLPQQSIIRGDQASLSIASASILAKVSRDRHMIVLDQQFPVYGFRFHKGYCTRAHEAALRQHGPCPIHRHTFAPIRPVLL